MRVSTQAKLLYALVIVAALWSMLGWLLRQEFMVRLLPSLATMKFNTALCFLLLAGSGLLLSLSGRSLARVGAMHLLLLLNFLVSGLTLLEYVAGFHTGLDQFLVTDPYTLPANFPGRMSSGTALCFLFAGISLWLALLHRIKAAQLLAFCLLFIALLALQGYLYDLDSLYGTTLFSTMALHTAVAFLLLAVALMLQTVGQGFLRVLNRDSGGGRMARQLLPVVTLLPLLLSGIGLMLRQRFDITDNFSIFLISLCTSALLFWTALSFTSRLHLYEIRDQRKQRENARLGERLSRAQRAEFMGLAAGGIVHDLKNILLSSMLVTEYCQSQLDKDHPLYQHLAQLRRSNELAGQLSGKILDIGKKARSSREEILIGELIADTLPILRGISGPAITLELQLEENERGVILGDPDQIQQVLLNLVVNARDAMPDGGRILIESQYQRIVQPMLDNKLRDMRDGDYVMLAVRDTGSGMDSATQTQLLKPFFSGKADGKGTGLGLSTVKTIVDGMGGALWFYSEPGIGTSFKIYFPLRAGTASAPEEACAPAPQLASIRGKTLLVMDDNLITRELIAVALEAQAGKVLRAATLAEISTIAADPALHIDLLITDLHLQESDGRKAYRLLSRQQPDMKVVFMSGFQRWFIGDGERNGEPGLPDILQKPFPLSSLASRIDAVLAPARLSA